MKIEKIGSADRNAARVVGLFVTFAITFATRVPGEAAGHKILIPCQVASGPYAVVKPPDPQSLFCDASWMKAAKSVPCPSTFKAYDATCYMPRSGTGIVVYERAPETVRFGWCSRTRSGALACELSLH